MTLKKLLSLADNIQDTKLREMVLDVLKNPYLSNKNLKYPPADLEKIPASVNWHHVQEGGLVEHTIAVTKLCIKFADVYEEVYKKKLDRDSLIAAALVHDIGKLWSFKKKGKAWQPTSLTLDHTMLGTAELYARGFPEHVLHIVASHFGENGPTPPQTPEALLFHYIDTMDALLTAEESSAEDMILQIFGE